MKDQGQEGSCFAFAGAGQREFLYRHYTQNEQRRRTVLPGDAIFSPQYLFYRVHELEGTLKQDCGGQIRSVFKRLNATGICLEKSDPYNPTSAWVVPTPGQDSEALLFEAGAYHRLTTVDDMRSCLASGYAFLAGFAVHDSFEKENWLASGVMPIPKASDALLGGHAVLFFGYDDSRQPFNVRSSWGPHWKLGGNFWFPYEADADSNVLWDA